MEATPMSAHFDSIAFKPSLPARRPFAAALKEGRMRAARIAELARTWRRRYRSRAALRALNERQILDFCHSLTDARREMNKPFWRA
jgi:uncharacterized protein YjiS (DUF1127 family)